MSDNREGSAQQPLASSPSSSDIIIDLQLVNQQEQESDQKQPKYILQIKNSKISDIIISSINLNLSFNDLLVDKDINNKNNSDDECKTTLPLPHYLLESNNERFKRDFSLPFVSICLCMKNASLYIDETLLSVVLQSYRGPIELSMFDDLSTDDTIEIAKKWIVLFKHYSIMFVLNGGKGVEQRIVETHSIPEYQLLVDSYRARHPNSQSLIELGEDTMPLLESGGCGYARNKAIQYSHGDYLCILDSDDIMYRERIELQIKECLKYKDDGDDNVIVGSNFLRIPEGSSNRYTEWCNRLTNEELYLHQYRECTIIQPTWFMRRDTCYRVGGFSTQQSNLELYKVNESPTSPTTAITASTSPTTPIKKQPIPEDLIFFHKHLQLEGKLGKIKLEYLEKRVLNKWSSFSIWGAGRDGKKFFTMLSDDNKNKVKAFCDVDTSKIGRNYNAAYTNQSIPIIHFSEVKPPLIMCVSLDRTNQEFENNIKSLNIVEGIDYWQFN
ncbi:hypothetical protein PPL_03166 [Heterostelium album PN500]|uniref:Glycosyltransferase 2-like domain-containing protein n=1 Tax=Heterostelium pallidum (strain ATCC 26659 / Pp 5 / PN500) TaxID=670386 RepID=D3B445_HETP5|nr:hypothetical protein PPL_03166 [Heterostelium album PN500]EFA84093.1 hypothetical protein PPL_03166 [Heterostelium album PN500]|eukprot:XP_020436210.1 hypothetical protein PPL_03166 [Heterostelium album PN500]